jgi:DNA-binding SARP family transcriptional activator
MLEVRLLGAFEARVDGHGGRLASTRAQSLLAYLALRNGRPQRRDRVAYLLWPDSTDQQARTNLRARAAHAARRHPGGGRFLSTTRRH